MITINSQLDMTPGAIPVVIHRSQYDSDFSIVFTLFARMGDFTIASGTTAKVRGTKKSGTGYSADATLDISAKTVTVTGDQQMTVASGQNIFEIVLLSGTSELCSANFILDVERAALDMDTITDDTVARELDNLEQFVTDAEAAADRAETAAVRAENSMSVAQKIADQVFYYTFDENFVSFEETSTGLNITLPYRFYIHYLKSSASVQKTLASGVSSVTYECPNNDYLVFDLEDNTVKHWSWADISSANKDDYILFANISSKNIVGGILKPYYNRYKIKLLENENMPKALKNIRESGLGVNFDVSKVKFERTNTGLDIILPYRCYIFGDKTNNIYQKNLNGLSTGTFTISWNLSGYVVLDINTGIVSVDDWAGIANRTDPFIVLASLGKRVDINGIYYPLFGAGALLPYFNQYMNAETDSERNNGRIVPPYYYFIDDYLPNKAISIRNKAKSADVSFGFVTDYHVGFNMRKSMILMKYLADKTNAIPFVLFGGDAPKMTGTEEEALAAGDAWLEDASIFGKENVYQCKGNHDYMINTSDSASFYANVKTDYYYIRKPTEQKVNGEAEKLYYYFDDEVNKVRYIVLDNYDAGYTSGNYNSAGMSQDQYNWLINLLNTNEYDILVLSHQTSDPTLANYEAVLEPLQAILKAFVAKGTLSYTGNGITLSADFSGKTARLICHLSGHSHNDESHLDSGVLSIVTVCDAYFAEPSGYSRDYSGINEQAFDVFCITKSSRTIEIIRIGAGSDRQFTY